MRSPTIPLSPRAIVTHRSRDIIEGRIEGRAAVEDRAAAGRDPPQQDMQLLVGYEQAPARNAEHSRRLEKGPLQGRIVSPLQDENLLAVL